MTRSPFPALFALAAALILLPSAVGQDEDKKKDDYKEKTASTRKTSPNSAAWSSRRPSPSAPIPSRSFLDFLKAEFEKDLPKEKAERYQRGYAKFGLIPADLDIYEAYLELFGSSIAGFYHPKTKELRLIRAGEKGDAEEDALRPWASTWRASRSSRADPRGARTRTSSCRRCRSRTRRTTTW